MSERVWWPRGAVVAGVVMVGLLWASAAAAQEGAGAKNEEKLVPDLEISLGIKGGLNGSWTTEIPENDPNSPVGDPDYFPLFGLGGGFGGVFELRAFGWLGLETGYFLSFDNGKGWNDITQAGSSTVITRLNQEQKTTSARIPLLLKFSSPKGTVRPALGLGVEFVRQSESSIKYSEEPKAGRLADGELDEIQRRNQIEPSNYVAAALTLGLEIDLGDVRIPIELRGMYNLNYSDDFASRVRATQDGNQPTLYYNGAYQGHFGLFVGVIYDYSLFF